MIGSMNKVSYRELAHAPKYRFGSDGSIVGPRGKILVGSINSRGYRQVLLHTPGRRKQYLVNRLICEAFRGPPPGPAMHAAHLDGNHLNNAEGNLAWKSAKANAQDKIAHGTVGLGERNGWTDLNRDAVKQIRSDRDSGMTFTELSRKHGVSRSTAFNVVRGVTWGHIK
jgi:hypothetical protein